MSYNWTEAVAACVKECFSPQWDSYFTQNNYASGDWPVNSFLLTVNAVTLLGTTILCGMNCCCPCVCKKKPEDEELEPIIAAPIPRDDSSESLLQSDVQVNRYAPRQEAPPPPRPPRHAPGKVTTAARVAVAALAAGAVMTLSGMAFVWLYRHDQQNPLRYVEGLIKGCYTNCTH